MLDVLSDGVESHLKIGHISAQVRAFFPLFEACRLVRMSRSLVFFDAVI